MNGPQAPPGDAAGRRPEDTGPTLDTTQAAADLKSPPTVADAGDVPVQLRHRRATAWRCPPLADGRRDPIDPQRVNALTSSPSTFSLSPDELRRHANDLVQTYGWSVQEVLAVLDIEPAGAR
jgi:hypothetical protein